MTAFPTLAQLAEVCGMRPDPVRDVLREDVGLAIFAPAGLTVVDTPPVPVYYWPDGPPKHCGCCGSIHDACDHGLRLVDGGGAR